MIQSFARVVGRQQVADRLPSSAVALIYEIAEGRWLRVEKRSDKLALSCQVIFKHCD
jgi:hypothetical protein